MNNDLFRNLDEPEVEAFRQWARENYRPGQDINPLWHPVVRDQCVTINLLREARDLEHGQE